MPKISRVRTGCWTCKRRHRKCDEARPTCKNCASTGRACEGYNVRYSFDTDVKKGRHMENSLHIENSLHNRKGSHANPSSDPKRSHANPLSDPKNHDANSSPSSTSHETELSPRTSMLQAGASGMVEGSPRSKGDGKYHDTRKVQMWLHDNEDLMFSEIFRDTIPLANVNVADPPPLPRSGKTFDGNVDNVMSHAPKLALKLTFQEENKLLRHFFNTLLPLLDAHPHSPWPKLALRHCDFDLARSCFISLACIHIHSREGGHEYYQQGIAHIHSTMQYLITYISENEALEQTREERHSQSFIILVLVNVHILFAVLDKGQSSLSRYFFEVFGSICSDMDFCRSLLNHHSKGALIVALSWYDTVSAVVSPDCRVPFCKPELYGSSFNAISTTQIMGCPWEIFRAMYEVCYLRNQAYKGVLKDDMDFNHKFQSVKEVVFGYRDYIDFSEGPQYILNLKCAQCWSLAVYVTILRIFKTEVRSTLIRASIREFIDVYGSMPSDSPLVTQMVWPLFAMACECTCVQEQEYFRTYMDRLNDNVQMGTLSSLRWIVKEVWSRGISQEAVLQGWLDDGVDYHPL